MSPIIIVCMWIVAVLGNNTPLALAAAMFTLVAFGVFGGPQ